MTWRDYSQIKIEIVLIKVASQKNYAYYHLISGVDLLLKSQEEFHQFFKKHNGKEFIHFAKKTYL